MFSVSLVGLGFYVVALSSTAIFLLGYFVFTSDIKSITNKFFFALTIAFGFWSILNFLSDKVLDPEFSLIIVRLVMFCAVFQAFTFFSLMYVFPERHIIFPKIYKYIIVSAVVACSILTLTPFVFSSVEMGQAGAGLQPIPGPGILFFALVAIPLVISGIIILIKKRLGAKTKEQKVQFKFLLAGVTVMFVLIIIFNFLFTVFLKNTTFVPISAAFTLPFVVMTAYAIVRHHLFNIRIIATQMLVVTIWIILFSKIFTSTSLADRITDSFIFIITIPFGILLIRSLIREVHLAQQQYEMVATVSHQLRTPLTPVIGLSAMIADGDFDSDPKELKEMERKVQMSAQRLRNVINDFLESFELEGGKKFENESSNVLELINEAMAGVKDSYEKKGLTLRFENTANLNPVVRGERKLLIQVFSNLLDNSEKYTPTGGTTVKLKQEGSHVVVTISDTGIGLTDEDKVNLFKKFYRSDTAKEIRPDGSGLGLSIVRKILEVHGAKIVVSSPGPNLGTTFTITLPKR